MWGGNCILEHERCKRGCGTIGTKPQIGTLRRHQEQKSLAE